MNDIETQFDKIALKIFFGLSEIIGIIVISGLSALVGIIIFFARKYIYRLLQWCGIGYFQERLKIIKEINSDLLWCQGALRADSYALFRTYNGKSYVEDNIEPSHKDTGRRKVVSAPKKITVELINSKPEDFYPQVLDNDIYKSIIDLSITNDWQLISYDYVKEQNEVTPLLVFLEANDIDFLMSFRIWNKLSKTYGIILFTWRSKPEIDLLYTREVDKKLDSIAIRFQNHIESSVMEKLLNVRMSI